MAAKIKLDVSPYSDISVIAICSSMRDYKFIWYLNKYLNLNFYQPEPIVWRHEKLKSNIEYAIFKCKEHHDIVFFNNHNENFHLIPSLATFDFFLVFSENAEKDYIEEWMKKIRKIQGVSILTLLTDKNLKLFSEIMSELEFQEIQRNIEKKSDKNNFFE
jgi:hypothetical protein